MNPGNSPEEITVRISSAGVELPVDDWWTAGVVPSDATWGPVFRPWLVPVVRWAGEALEADAGFGFSTGYPRISLSQAQIEPGSEASGSVELYGDLSLALSSRLVAQDLRPNGDRFRAAVRLYLPVSIAHARASAGATVRTDDLALPAAADYRWTLTGWYPGRGAGAGIRVDLGIAWQRNAVTAGVGLVGVLSAFGGEGFDFLASASSESGGQASATLETVTYAPGRPVPTAAAHLDLPGLFAAAEAWYADRLVVRSGVRVAVAPRIELLAGAGWQGTPTGSLGIGITVWDFRIDSGARLLQPIPGTSTGGFPPIGVSISLSRAGRRR